MIIKHGLKAGIGLQSVLDWGRTNLEHYYPIHEKTAGVIKSTSGFIEDIYDNGSVGGIDFSQAVAASRAGDSLIGGYECADFDNTNDEYTKAGITTKTVKELWAAVRLNSLTSGVEYILRFKDTISPTNTLELRTKTGTSEWNFKSNDGTARTVVEPATNNNIYILRCVCDGPSSLVRTIKNSVDTTQAGTLTTGGCTFDTVELGYNGSVFPDIQLYAFGWNSTVLGSSIVADGVTHFKTLFGIT